MLNSTYLIYIWSPVSSPGQRTQPILNSPSGGGEGIHYLMSRSHWLLEKYLMLFEQTFPNLSHREIFTRLSTCFPPSTTVRSTIQFYACLSMWMRVRQRRDEGRVCIDSVHYILPGTLFLHHLLRSLAPYCYRCAHSLGPRRWTSRVGSWLRPLATTWHL